MTHDDVFLLSFGSFSLDHPSAQNLKSATSHEQSQNNGGLPSVKLTNTSLNRYPFGNGVIGVSSEVFILPNIRPTHLTQMIIGLDGTFGT